MNAPMPNPIFKVDHLTIAYPDRRGATYRRSSIST